MKQQTVQLKYFYKKVHIVCLKCPPLAETHSFRRMRRSLIDLLIVVCGKSSLTCCDAFLAREWYLVLGEVCDMPEVLHPTHGSQVG